MLDAKTIAMLQMEANQSAARRSGKSGARLLDDAENNVGSATILQPEILPPGQNFTVVKQSNPPRVLNLTAESKTGQSVTVVMTAARQANTVGLAGPVTGIIEFGNGTQTTKIEFDVPIGPYTGFFENVTPGTQPDDSGAVIQVPTGIVRSYFRYDDAYITPQVDGTAISNGTSAPSYNPAGLSPTPLSVKAFANYFGRHHTKLYKTLYLYIGAPITFAGAYSIPAFAKSIQVIRASGATPMSLTLTDQLIPEVFLIPPGTAPIIPITGNQNIFVLNTAGIDPVQRVKVVFEIGF